MSDLNNDNPFAGDSSVNNPDDFVFDDDVLTEEEFEQLNSFGVPDGFYKFKVTAFDAIPPTDEKVGGRQVTLQVVETEVPEPTGGFQPMTLLFKKYKNPTEGQRKSEEIDRRKLSHFLKACGVEVQGRVNLTEALKATVGMEVYATVSSREVNDTTYKDIKKFKAV
jgi:hypothetical protein